MAKLENPKEITREVADKIFSDGKKKDICDALLSLSMYHKDWRWIQNQCLLFLNNVDPEISGLAATCLGHIARIHHKLDKKLVIQALKKKINDPYLSGRVQDALDDIEIFLNLK